jgi:hypothetical protein
MESGRSLWINRFGAGLGYRGLRDWLSKPSEDISKPADGHPEGRSQHGWWMLGGWSQDGVCLSGVIKPGRHGPGGAEFLLGGAADTGLAGCWRQGWRGPSSKIRIGADASTFAGPTADKMEGTAGAARQAYRQTQSSRSARRANPTPGSMIAGRHPCLHPRQSAQSAVKKDRDRSRSPRRGNPTLEPFRIRAIREIRG